MSNFYQVRVKRRLRKEKVQQEEARLCGEDI